MDGPTDGPTDGQTDIPSYRDAKTQLKTGKTELEKDIRVHLVHMHLIRVCLIRAQSTLVHGIYECLIRVHLFS